VGDRDGNPDVLVAERDEVQKSWSIQARSSPPTTATRTSSRTAGSVASTTTDWVSPSWIVALMDVSKLALSNGARSRVRDSASAELDIRRTAERARIGREVFMTRVPGSGSCPPPGSVRRHSGVAPTKCAGHIIHLCETASARRACRGMRAVQRSFRLEGRQAARSALCPNSALTRRLICSIRPPMPWS
jgi:hypothetical protein